jgi:hypothetical protein
VEDPIRLERPVAGRALQGERYTGPRRNLFQRLYSSETDQQVAPGLIGLARKDALNALRGQGLRPRIIGRGGQVSGQSPTAGDPWRLRPPRRDIRLTD